MNKSLIIALIATGIGVCTLAVGLYILATTPAPAPEPQAQAVAASEPMAVIPQLRNSDSPLVPDADAPMGSEPWCEALMAKPDREWSESESRQFAEHRIYE